MTENLLAFSYLTASVLFILALKGLSSPKTAGAGNNYGKVGILLAIVTAIAAPQVMSYEWIVAGIVIGGAIGTFIALRINMTSLPQLVAGFHSLVGLAAVCVATAAFLHPHAFHIGDVGTIKQSSLIEMVVGVAIGAITFTGSLVAFGKLQGLISGKPLAFKAIHLINLILAVIIVVCSIQFVLSQDIVLFVLIILLSFVLGITLIMPIGGADMPVIVSMLNSYSGWAAAGIGFTLENNLLIITGALVGASGAILSYIMCKGMNRSIFNVVLGGFGGNTATVTSTQSNQSDRPVKSGSAEDAAYIMSNAQSVIIVPGYGMAVAQAQHSLSEMATKLKSKGINVRYAIHPVAGRMPGHMNVLLAEANVSYEDVLELEEINRDFGQTDVVFVIGANDVTNPAAKTDPQSPIYGMPILDVEKAKTVLFVKRSMAAGYAGVENELFYRDNTMMLFGDAKKVCEDIIKSFEH